MIIEQINKNNDNFRQNKQIYQSIANRIFGEKTTIYVYDTVDEIVENLLNNLVLERFMNKQNPEVNWNNIRYFEKEGKDKKPL